MTESGVISCMPVYDFQLALVEAADVDIAVCRKSPSGCVRPRHPRWVLISSGLVSHTSFVVLHCRRCDLPGNPVHSPWACPICGITPEMLVHICGCELLSTKNLKEEVLVQRRRQQQDIVKTQIYPRPRLVVSILVAAHLG